MENFKYTRRFFRYLKKYLLYLPIILLLLSSIAIYSYFVKTKNLEKKIPFIKEKEKTIYRIIEQEKKENFFKNSKVNYIYIYLKDNRGYSKEFDKFKLDFENNYKDVIFIKKNYVKKTINDLLIFILKIIGVILFVTICFIKQFKGYINEKIIIFIQKNNLVIFILLLNFVYLFSVGLENSTPFEIEFKRKIIFSKINSGYFPEIKFIQDLLLKLTK